MQNKLKVLFLWHQHQPDYFYEGHYLMPWTRLHGVKDYFDLPELLNEFPEVKQNFNIVPSMAEQIENYISGAKDAVQILTEIPASQLTFENKQDVFKLFFRCNTNNLINKYWRFKELYEKSSFYENETENINAYSENDWRDLQVWYNLAWIGEFSKQTGLIKRLFVKGKDFTELEKQLLLEEHIEILNKIFPLYKKLQDLGQIEISVSPFYHPILPLLIDSEVAREAMPEKELPTPYYKYPEDANYQIKSGIKYCSEKFTKIPKSMWSSEGSLSDENLNLMIGQSIKYTASDEKLLLHSGNNLSATDKYFPHKYQTENGEIFIFFRDNDLSDKIGFEYQNWNAEDAANNFINQLREIKQDIVLEKGENSLDTAVVSVILDGENCWEYYPNNGIDFLRALFSKLQSGEFETTTFSQAIKGNQPYPIIEKLRAGSWINANFDIWIGATITNTAWNLLQKARQSFEEQKEKIDVQKRDEAYKNILIAEGSDWFWWYCPYHNADNEDEFDMIFRNRLKKVYELIDISIPYELNYPISEIAESDIPIDYKVHYFKQKNTAMHKNTNDFIFFAYIKHQTSIEIIIELIQKLDDEKIILEIYTPFKEEIIIDKSKQNNIENNRIYLTLDKLDKHLEYIQFNIQIKTNSNTLISDFSSIKL